MEIDWLEDNMCCWNSNIEVAILDLSKLGPVPLPKI